MTVAFPQFAKTKDNYCIAYYGNNNEYVVQLLYLADAIEKELPGIRLYIACKNNLSHLRKHFSTNRLILAQEINRSNFAYVRELKFDFQTHPVETILKESEIKLSHLTSPTPRSLTNKCVICPTSLPPTKSIEDTQIIWEKAIKEGYEPTLEQNITGAGWVIGVESEILYLAAAKGIRTTLIPSGIGTNFYKRLFPKNEILDIYNSEIDRQK